MDYRRELLLDQKNILRQKNKICANSKCRSTNIKYNGFHQSKSFILKKIGFDIKVGQCKCKSCGLSWSVDVSELYELLEKIKEQIREYAIEIRLEKNSYENTSKLLEKIIGKKYNQKTIRDWYTKRTRNIKEKKVESKTCSGYYVYDEQQVKCGGQKKFRLTLRDTTHKQPISEEITDDKKKETVRKFLLGSLKDKPKFSMTVDGDPCYPDIITKDLGMKYQPDLRHLFENISGTFKDECGYGIGHKKLHLYDELNKQQLFDVFYPRGELISFIKEGLKELKEIKNKDIKEQKDVELQNELKELKYERKKKRRRKGYVHEHINYTLEKARKKFEFVKTLRNIYQKNIQKIIDKIDKTGKVIHFI